MKTKLTLRVDDELIEAAKQEAEARGTSLSEMVSHFFHGLRAKNRRATDTSFAPITTELMGMLKGAKISEHDHKRHLEKKHR